MTDTAPRHLAPADEAWFRDEFLALTAERTTLATISGRGGYDARTQLARCDRKIDDLLDQWSATKVVTG
jgi:hypothetical protein